MNSLSVQRKNFAGKRNEVLHALSAWMQARPKFKVLDPVVVSDAILVMNGLAWKQRTPQVSGHDQPMDELPLSVAIDVLAHVALGIAIRIP